MGFKLGLVDTYKGCVVIKLLDDDGKDILSDFIQDNIAIRIKRQNSEGLRKIVEKKV